MTTRASACLISLMLSLGIGAAQASGPFPFSARAFDPYHPSHTEGDLLNGHLGIVDRRWPKRSLFIVYRQLAGLQFSPTEKEIVLRTRPPDVLVLSAWGHNAAVSSWLASRAAAGGNALGKLGNYFDHEITLHDETRYLGFFNCLNDAFDTARATLMRYRTTLPAWTARWIKAQDQVFSNCDGQAAPTVPEPPAPNWPPAVQRDRKYQIAAAYFYQLKFDRASASFSRIARDPASPWSSMADYLVVRTWLRKATMMRYGPEPALLRRAKDRLDQLIAGRFAHNASLRGASIGLRNRVMALLQPAERQRALAQTLLHPAAPQDMDKLEDYLYRLCVDTYRPVDTLHDWLCSSTAPALPPKLELLTALWSDSEHVIGPSVLQRAEAFPVDEPGWISIHYYLAQRLYAQGEQSRADRITERLLQSPLSLADANRVRVLRADYARSPSEFINNALLTPTEIGYLDTERSPLYPADQFANSLQTGTIKMIVAHQVDWLNTHTPLSVWMQLATQKHQNPGWLRRVRLSAFMRAVLLKRDQAALELADLAAASAPLLAPELRKWHQAPASDRPFEFAWIALRFPGLSPFLYPGVGREFSIDKLDKYRHNWWCRGTPANTSPHFVSQDQLQQGDREFKHPGLAAQAGVQQIATRVFAFASRHHSPRVAQALHLLVRATHYSMSCPYTHQDTVNGYPRTSYDAFSYKAISKAAFQQLHRDYPNSTWTKKTPYWYD